MSVLEAAEKLIARLDQDSFGMPLSERAIGSLDREDRRALRGEIAALKAAVAEERAAKGRHGHMVSGVVSVGVYWTIECSCGWSWRTRSLRQAGQRMDDHLLIERVLDEQAPSESPGKVE